MLALAARSWAVSSASLCLRARLRGPIPPHGQYLASRAMASEPSTETRGLKALLDAPRASEMPPDTMMESAIEDWPNQSVLLVRHGASFRALGSKCTHFGAPLAKGILTRDGKVVCPWHGSCFSIETGDVEEAPAFNTLNTFEVVVQDDRLYVDIKPSERPPFFKKGLIRTKSRPVTRRDIVTVIIGLGSGAVGCLETLVNNGYPGQIVVLTEPRQPGPYDRTKLSKQLPTEEDPLRLRSPAWLKNNHVDVVTDPAEKVLLKDKVVITEKGKKYPYTRLVIASGGKPVMLPMPGCDDENLVYYLRDLEHARAIAAGVGEGGKPKAVAIIGTSFIGMELANLLSADHSVTLIGMTEVPMDHVLGERVGRLIATGLKRKSIKFVMKSITKVARDDATPGRKLIHIEGRSDAIPADLVIIGAGVRPATDFLRCPESGVELLQDGSVGVDQYFAIKGATDAYAIGDIATFPYWGPGSGLFGGRTTTRIEHWNVAQNAGRAVGEYIAHSALSPLAKDPPPKEFVPIFWSALSGQLRYAGNTINGFDDVVVVNERTEPHVKFVAYYTVADTVVAVASMNSDPVVMKCAVLMRARRMLTKTEIQQGVSPLSVKV